MKSFGIVISHRPTDGGQKGDTNAICYLSHECDCHNIGAHYVHYITLGQHRIIAIGTHEAWNMFAI